MATSITALDIPSRVTLGSSDVATEVTFPVFATRFRVRFMANAGKIARTGTDGAAIGGAYETISADTICDFPLECRPGIETRQKRYFASATGSTVVEITGVR